MLHHDVVRPFCVFSAVLDELFPQMYIPPFNSLNFEIKRVNFLTKLNLTFKTTSNDLDDSKKRNLIFFPIDPRNPRQNPTRSVQVIAFFT